jgi:hypothetical protein
MNVEIFSQITFLFSSLTFVQVVLINKKAKSLVESIDRLEQKISENTYSGNVEKGLNSRLDQLQRMKFSRMTWNGDQQ